jgi:hypothetical protein
MKAVRTKESGFNLQITISDGSERTLIRLGLQKLRQEYQEHQAQSTGHPDPEHPDMAEWFAGEIQKIDVMLAQMNK